MPDDSSMAISNAAGLGRALREYIAKYPDVFGGLDIYNLDFETPALRAGVLAGVLTGLTVPNNKPAVRKFLVIIPKEFSGEDCQGRGWSEMKSTFTSLFGRPMEPNEENWYSARFLTIYTKDRKSDSVVEIVEAQTDGTAIIVIDAASYRDDKVEPFVPPGASTPLQSEDMWVPQLHALAVQLARVVRGRMLYVALDSNRLGPRRTALSELLLSVDGCGVMGMTRANDPEDILADHVDQWESWIRSGYLGRTLRDVEQLPDDLAHEKPFLRIQMLHRAGHFLPALEAIRNEIANSPNIDVQMRIRLARIAQDANASRLAIEILSPVISILEGYEDLERALSIAYDAGASQVEEIVAARLDGVFPGALGLRQRRRRALWAGRDYNGLAAMANSDPGDESGGAFYERLARFLTVSDVPDYHALIASAGDDATLSESLRMACVSDALERKLIVHALEFATPLPMEPAQAARGERLLIEVLENIFLFMNKDRTLAVPIERIQSATLLLIERLAADPSNKRLRFGLVRLIQPAVAGTIGLAMMAFLVMELVLRPLELKKGFSFSGLAADWLTDHKPFAKAAFKWLKSEEPVVIGRLALPDSLLTESPDDVVCAITDYLTYAPLDSNDDIPAFQLWLALATSVTPYCSDPDFDLRLMRLTAGKLASSGKTQAARDLAEQALQNSVGTPRRRRLGWFAMADVYHRCHNNLEGLLAMACTFAADTVCDVEQNWQEITGVARFLRDNGFYDEARATIAVARQLLQVMNVPKANSCRLDTLELQIQQRALQTKGWCVAELETLLLDVVHNGQDVLKYKDTTAPAAAMLGQLMRQARDVGATIPTEAHEIFMQLCHHAPGSIGSLVQTTAKNTPLVADLFAISTSTGATRYSDDVGFDMINIAMLAGRMLSSDAYIKDSVETSFALEMLADRGVAVPGWDEAAEPPMPPGQINEPAEFARSFSCWGVSVVQIGFDSEGRLIRVSCVAGHLDVPVRESTDVISEERIGQWATKYPYEYGIDEATANLFYITTSDLRLSALPKGPIVIVADVTLQSFPPNLFYVEDQFTGRAQPTAAAPSLAWLQAAHAKGMIGDGRICAWISTAALNLESQTLTMLAERLEPSFTQYGAICDYGPDLPVAFKGASMVILAAHGGVHPEGRYFQAVSDEGKLRVTAEDLANVLRNVGVVVLFVCSGGRTDKHPEANTTLGLAKQILDRGCAAVVASPWPLDARVPSHWLPVFLRHWFSGDTLMEANFRANATVDQAFAHDPARGLAMTVFGNPVLRKT